MPSIMLRGLLLCALPWVLQASAVDGHCATQDGQQCDDEVFLMQLQTRRETSPSSGSGPSTSALGCMTQRWALYSSGVLPRAWPDACFGSVTKGEVKPEAALVKQWMHDNCSCGWAPPKMDQVTEQSWFLRGGGEAPEELVERSKGIDHILDILLAATPHAQVVTLGGGFDGRFYSLSSLAAASRLYEMDGGDTQALKKALVKNCNLQPVSLGGVQFLHIDLTKDNVYENLFKDASFDKKQPTVFIAEAVFQYVPEKNVFKSLKILSNAMRENPASRLIMQCWQSDNKEDKGKKVFDDKVNFDFPANPEKRKAWWHKLGLTPDVDMNIQQVLATFKQNTANIPDEYLDVLAPLAML